MQIQTDLYNDRKYNDLKASNGYFLIMRKLLTSGSIYLYNFASTRQRGLYFLLIHIK